MIVILAVKDQIMRMICNNLDGFWMIKDKSEQFNGTQTVTHLNVFPIEWNTEIGDACARSIHCVVLYSWL